MLIIIRFFISIQNLNHILLISVYFLFLILYLILQLFIKEYLFIMALYNLLGF